MATFINNVALKSIVTLFCSVLLFGYGDLCESVPAIYTFGDSLVDVGNNNFLSASILKADFPHNGVDFPTGNATGRFSNGKNAADFLAEKVGLPTAPPYLSLVSKDNKLNNSTNATGAGVSFASGGAGILNGTNELYESIPLTQQVEDYTLVHNQLVQQMGAARAKTHLAKSLFVIVIGSNDLLSYFENDSQVSKQYTPQQYVNLMTSTLKQLLKRLYGLGARKFVVTGVGVIGCCPIQRLQMNRTDDACNMKANQWTINYNIRLKILLKKLKIQLPYINYSYFDTYGAMNNLIQDPQIYGISEIKEACCGMGRLNAEIPCLPIADYCSNRNDHLFWDLYHPTETVSRMLTDLLYNGSRQFTIPMNVEYLVRI